MITLTIESKMRDDLKLIYNQQVVQLGRSLQTWLKYASANRRNEYRAKFDRAVEFLHMLNAAQDYADVPTLAADHPRAGSPLMLSDDFDPRASDPQCTHGRSFNEPCNLCAAPLFGLPPLDLPNRAS